jgi:Ca-activated chloride channel family protein
VVQSLPGGFSHKRRKGVVWQFLYHQCSSWAGKAWEGKGVHAMGKRPLEELQAWARLAAEDELLVGIAGSANSPTNAHELAYIETGDAEKAKSCRWLAMIKRDYGKEAFNTFVSSVTSDRPRKKKSTGRKGASTMEETARKEEEQVESGKVSIPLKHITYRTALNGAFARVRCIQEFENDANNPVEAVYVFPLPDEASVTGCAMKIGKRKVEAELKKREEAKREYEEAVSQGHHGALLEQERPNIFTMKVGGIEPGENISVEVSYVQRVSWQAGGGRFVIPLVVPPQFIPGVPTGKQAGGWSPDTDEVPDASRITPNVAREGVPYNADVSILFSPGFRCKLSCPSHETIIAEQTVAKADTVELKTGDIRTDRDFTLVYTSLSKVPEVAVHSGKTKDEGFLLASIIPPGEAAPVPSDIALVLDCSRSMDGTSISGLKVVAKKVLQRIREDNLGHRVGIVPFNNLPLPEYPLSEVTEATERFIDGLQASGGTMLGYALEKAKEMLTAQDSGRPGIILMVTDGDTEHGKNWYGDGIRLIAVGIGVAVNDTRINTLADRNSGVAEFVYPGENYGEVAGRLAGYLSGPVLRDVKAEGKGDVVGVADVFKGRPATIAVRFAEKSAGSIRITGKDPEGRECSWEVKPGAQECDFAYQVWAREFIRENPEVEEELVKVSLKYGIICQHTSFVAVSLKEVPGQKPERVEIPVNLPDGWVFESVFGQTGSFAFAMPNVVHVDDITLGSLRGVTRSIRPGVKSFIGGGEAATLPKFPKPKLNLRFTLDAKDPADLMVAILNAILRNNRPGAEKALKRLKGKLTPAKADGLDEEKRSMAFYFALRLAKHGLKLGKNVMDKLSAKPKGAVARAWHNLALKEQGRPFNSDVPQDNEASGYLSWKFGLGSRPLIGEWADVL